MYRGNDINGCVFQAYNKRKKNDTRFKQQQDKKSAPFPLLNITQYIQINCKHLFSQTLIESLKIKYIYDIQSQPHTHFLQIYSLNSRAL